MECEKAKKIRGLLSSFVHTNDQNREAKSDEVNSGEEPENQSQAKHSRDKKAFVVRLQSYKPFNWFAKPDWFSPPVCVRYGWQNVDRDLLQCVSCKCYITGKMPSSYQPGVYDECCKKLEESLKTAHHPFCPWSNNPSPESYLNVTIPSRAQLRSLLEDLISYGNKLPIVKEDVLTQMNMKPASLQRLQDSLNMTVTCETPVFISACVLILCGWQAKRSSSKKSLCVSCSYCTRECGLWNYKSLCNNPDSEESDQDNDIFSPLKKPTVCSNSNGLHEQSLNGNGDSKVVDGAESNQADLKIADNKINSEIINNDAKKQNEFQQEQDKILVGNNLQDSKLSKETIENIVSKTITESNPEHKTDTEQTNMEVGLDVNSKASDIEEIQAQQQLMDHPKKMSDIDKKRSKIDNIVHSLKSKIEQTNDCQSTVDIVTKEIIDIPKDIKQTESLSQEKQIPEGEDTSNVKLNTESSNVTTSSPDVCSEESAEKKGNSHNNSVTVVDANYTFSPTKNPTKEDDTDPPEQARNDSDSESESACGQNDSLVEILVSSSEEEIDEEEEEAEEEVEEAEDAEEEDIEDSDEQFSNDDSEASEYPEEEDIPVDDQNQEVSFETEERDEDSEMSEEPVGMEQGYSDVEESNEEKEENDEQEDSEVEQQDDAEESDEIMILSSDSEDEEKVSDEPSTEHIQSFQPLGSSPENASDDDENEMEDLNVIVAAREDEGGDSDEADLNLKFDVADDENTNTTDTNGPPPLEIGSDSLEFGSQLIPESDQNKSESSNSWEYQQISENGNIEQHPLSPCVTASTHDTNVGSNKNQQGIEDSPVEIKSSNERAFKILTYIRDTESIKTKTESGKESEDIVDNSASVERGKIHVENVEVSEKQTEHYKNSAIGNIESSTSVQGNEKLSDNMELAKESIENKENGNNVTVIDASKEVESKLNDSCTTPTGVSRKRKKKSMREAFNPFTEHRPWCPWVQGSFPGQANSNRQPGWKQMVVNIVPEASPEKEDIIKIVKTSPPYESLRRIRRLFHGWASPHVK